jgi:hypothetical protein
MPVINREALSSYLKINAEEVSFFRLALPQRRGVPREIQNLFRADSIFGGYIANERSILSFAFSQNRDVHFF